ESVDGFHDEVLVAHTVATEESKTLTKASSIEGKSMPGCYTLAAIRGFADPVLVPYNDSRLAGTMVTIKREVRSHRTLADTNVAPNSEKSGENLEPDSTFSDVISFTMTSNCLLQNDYAVPVKISNKLQSGGKSQFSESSQPTYASVHAGSSSSRPSSNYGSRSQVIGTKKAGSTKEWKPKTTNSTIAQVSGIASSTEVPNAPVESVLHQFLNHSHLQEVIWKI
ncbi:unnamed protein product, partial [Linum tenue]